MGRLYRKMQGRKNLIKPGKPSLQFTRALNLQIGQ
jgi:hypothetical protein